MKKTEIFGLVRDYLLKGQFKYGAAISSLDILKDAGHEPQVPDTKCAKSVKRQAEIEYLTAKYYDDYLALGAEVANEVLEHLIEFGFAADRVPRADHNNSVVHVKGCTIYTRFPWDVYYKARKAEQMAEDFMNMIHDSSVDMLGLKSIALDVYDSGYQFLDLKKERATEFSAANEELNEVFDNFHELLMTKKDELVKIFKQRQPENYGQYAVETGE